MFVPMKDIVDAAYAGKYGVPAVPSNDEVQILSLIHIFRAAARYFHRGVRPLRCTSS